MDIKEIRRYRLRKLILTRFSGVASRFAEHIGKQPSYIARIFSSNPEHARNIGEGLAREIERLCDLEEGFLDRPLTKVEAFGAFDPATNAPELERAAQKQRETCEKIPALRYEAGGHQIVLIQRLLVEELDGPGDSIALDESWLKRNVTYTDANNLWLISNIGDAMSPTIGDGDLLLVDTGISSVAYDAIYVFFVNDLVRINRIQRELDGGLRIISDNAHYSDLVVPPERRGDVKVAARVVYAWSGTAF